ncbi:CubicO group peptidase (beta-lactamase class C family) [Bacillus pakistanensis]|uniref:CubicO group peptidase (Beta-lactamase class C family) n=1 Tax=Rossellomorea pakistanensis TaxID=992288 RepID=A0ABS2NJU9_9BACI|nr:serine hydrolase [Bacillus pakistanensis]MBM7588104.1 CubicO group peptidase (beta-lactamase class C family) [Bacillus pakistanensis]
MVTNTTELTSVVKETVDKVDFSGAVLLKNEKDVIHQSAFGYANRVEKQLNIVDTRFGIASGCKLFTAIGICQLVEKGIISFQSRLTDCLEVELPKFDKNITIHHLLTHSSGVPDYFDEDVMDDFEDLWKERPMYLLKGLEDFLPMFQMQPMMFKPGERFQYNNAGFILLGLVIEQQTGRRFTEYIETEIFNQCGMEGSGYFSLDQLPANTAFGYIDSVDDGTWRTNTYSIPIKGGADGGAYITSPDMMRLWEGLLEYKLLCKEYTNLLLKPHICVKEESYYGYGVWINKKEDKIFKYHVMGYDPGVSFHSSVYPESGYKLVVPSNKERGPFNITKAIEDYLFG